ncbi:MAG: hypothetical protein V4692_05175 [Bdellovibrionota bacterium]
MNQETQTDRDLHHFLKLALAQLQAKVAHAKSEKSTYDGELRRLQLLEELIKEQVPSK